MGLFKSKKKGGSDATNQGTQAKHKAVPDNKKAKKSKKDGMASLISESVPESALEIMRSNDSFIVERDGTDVYVGMLLKVEDIGGLSKKQSIRDADKGSIVELINSGRIAAYVPETLLEAEQLFIIPTAGTLDAMDEYPILTDAPYSVAIVDNSGEVENLDVPVTFDAAVEISVGNQDVMDFLASSGVDWASGEADYDEDADEDEYATSVMEPVTDDEPEDDFMPEDDESEFIPDEDTDFENVSLDDVMPSDDYMDDDAADDGYADEDGGTGDDAEAEPEEETVVDEETVTRAVNYRFYSDELGLEVNGDPFDAQFMAENPYVPFNENRGEGWLNQYLNEVSMDANMAMKRMHAQNLLRLRERYYSLISLHCETIQMELDPSNPETQYGRMSNAINEHYASQKRNMNDIVSRRREELNKTWDETLQRVGEDAAHAAQQQYRERYGRQHNDDLMRVEVDAINSIEAERQSGIRDMNAERRAEAARRLDYGIIETLKTLSDEYSKMLDDETEAYQEWRSRIKEFLDDHRKDDIARSQALAEELAQSQKADRVLQEYTAKLAAAREGYEQSRQTMQADIEHLKLENEQRIRDKSAECDSRVQRMQEQLDAQEVKYNELLDRYATLDKQKTEEFNHRLSEANDQKLAWQSKCDDMAAASKRFNIVAVAFCVVAVIAAACVGMFVGTQMNIDFGSSKASTHIQQEFNDRMDDIEKDKKSDSKAEADKTESKAEPTPEAPKSDNAQ